MSSGAMAGSSSSSSSSSSAAAAAARIDSDELVLSDCKAFISDSGADTDAVLILNSFVPVFRRNGCNVTEVYSTESGKTFEEKIMKLACFGQRNIQEPKKRENHYTVYSKMDAPGRTGTTARSGWLQNNVGKLGDIFSEFTKGSMIQRMVVELRAKYSLLPKHGVGGRAGRGGGGFERDIVEITGHKVGDKVSETTFDCLLPDGTTCILSLSGIPKRSRTLLFSYMKDEKFCVTAIDNAKHSRSYLDCTLTVIWEKPSLPKSVIHIVEYLKTDGAKRYKTIHPDPNEEVLYEYLRFPGVFNMSILRDYLITIGKVDEYLRPPDKKDIQEFTGIVHDGEDVDKLTVLVKYTDHTTASFDMETLARKYPRDDAAYSAMYKMLFVFLTNEEYSFYLIVGCDYNIDEFSPYNTFKVRLQFLGRKGFENCVYRGQSPKNPQALNHLWVTPYDLTRRRNAFYYYLQELKHSNPKFNFNNRIEKFITVRGLKTDLKKEQRVCTKIQDLICDGPKIEVLYDFVGMKKGGCKLPLALFLTG